MNQDYIEGLELLKITGKTVLTMVKPFAKFVKGKVTSNMEELDITAEFTGAAAEKAQFAKAGDVIDIIDGRLQAACYVNKSGKRCFYTYINIQDYNVIKEL